MWTLGALTVAVLFGLVALSYYAEASVTLLIAGRRSQDVYKRSLARRLVPHFDSLYNELDGVAFSLFVENDDVLGALNDPSPATRRNSNPERKQPLGLALGLQPSSGAPWVSLLHKREVLQIDIHVVRRLNSSSVTIVLPGMEELSLEHLATLHEIIYNTDGVVFVEIGDPAVQTEPFLQKAAFCWGETSLNIESPNRAFLCNQLDVANVRFLNIIGLRPLKGETKTIKRREVMPDYHEEIQLFPNIFASAKEDGRRGRKPVKKVVKEESEEEEEDDEEEEVQAEDEEEEEEEEEEEKREVADADDDDDDENNEKRLGLKKKVRCRYRKSCYESGVRPDAASWNFHVPNFLKVNELLGIEKKKVPKVKKDEDDEEEDENEEEEEEDDLVEQKLKCKYKPSCYRERGIPLDKRTEETEARFLSAKKQVAEGKKRTIKDIATSTLRRVEEEKEKRIHQPPSNADIVEKVLNEAEEKLQKKLNCKYRKSCYDTGVVPELEPGLFDNFHLPAIIKLPKSEEEEVNFEELEEPEKKFRCKYRKSCYETGELPDLSAHYKFKIVEIAKTDEREIPLAEKCKYRKSCYETGIVPDFSKPAVVSESVIKKAEATNIPSNIATLKFFCKYRKSCYEELAQADGATTVKEIAKRRAVTKAESKVKKREQKVVKIQGDIYRMGKQRGREGRLIRSGLREAQEKKAKEHKPKSDEPKIQKKISKKYEKIAKEVVEEAPKPVAEAPATPDKKAKKGKEPKIEKVEEPKVEAESPKSKKGKKEQPKEAEKEEEKEAESPKEKKGKAAKLAKKIAEDAAAAIAEEETKAKKKESVKEKKEEKKPEVKEKKAEKVVEKPLKQAKKPVKKEESEEEEEKDDDDSKEEIHDDGEDDDEEPEPTKPTKAAKPLKHGKKASKKEESEEDEDEEKEDEDDEPEPTKPVKPVKKPRREEKKEDKKAVKEEVKEPPKSVKSKKEEKKKAKEEPKEEEEEDEEEEEKAPPPPPPKSKQPKKQDKKKAKEPEPVDEDADDEEIAVHAEAPKAEPPAKSKKTKKEEKKPEPDAPRKSKKEAEGEKPKPAKKKRIKRVLPEDQRDPFSCKYRKSCYENGEVPDIRGLSNFFTEPAEAPVAHSIEGRLSETEEKLRKKLACKYRKSCYETGEAPEIASSTFFSFFTGAAPEPVKKVIEEDEITPFACKYRKSCYETGVLPDFKKIQREQKKAAEAKGEVDEDRVDEALLERKGRRLKVACKYRKSCYETGERPDIDQSFGALFDGLSAHVDATYERKVSPNSPRSEEDKKLDCKYRKSCYETGKLPETLAETPTVIQQIREGHGISRELRCKYRKSCYETLEAEAPEKVEEIVKKVEKPHVKPPKEEKRSKPETPKRPADDRGAKEEKTEKEKKSDKKKKHVEKPKEVEEEEQEERIVQREEAEDGKERASLLNVAQKTRCKYRHSCYVGVKPASLSEDHAATVARVINGTVVRTKCHKYYLSCREVLGLPPKEKAPIGPNGRRLCRKKKVEDK